MQLKPRTNGMTRGQAYARLVAGLAALLALTGLWAALWMASSPVF